MTKSLWGSHWESFHGAELQVSVLANLSPSEIYNEFGRYCSCLSLLDPRARGILPRTSVAQGILHWHLPARIQNSNEHFAPAFGAVDCFCLGPKRWVIKTDCLLTGHVQMLLITLKKRKIMHTHSSSSPPALSMI